jgi:peptidoglycan/LPS O-acetylase OafA/YrhL
MFRLPSTQATVIWLPRTSPLLLMLRKRAGIWLTTAAAIIVGLVPHFFFHHYALNWASPWFLGLFALGMLAANISLSEAEKMNRLRDRLPWGAISLVLFAPGFLIGIKAANETNWKADMFIGAATARLLISCARAAMRRDSALRQRLKVHRSRSPSAT